MILSAEPAQSAMESLRCPYLAVNCTSGLVPEATEDTSCIRSAGVRCRRVGFGPKEPSAALVTASWKKRISGALSKETGRIGVRFPAACLTCCWHEYRNEVGWAEGKEVGRWECVSSFGITGGNCMFPGLLDL